MGECFKLYSKPAAYALVLRHFAQRGSIPSALHFRPEIREDFRIYLPNGGQWTGKYGFPVHVYCLTIHKDGRTKRPSLNMLRYYTAQSGIDAGEMGIVIPLKAISPEEKPHMSMSSVAICSHAAPMSILRP